MKGTRSLSFIVTLWSGLAIAASMAVYAVFQYWSLPGMTIAELFLHHLWHVLVLGVVIYAMCSAVFHHVLVRPLNEIYLHLYKVGKGQLLRLDMDTQLAELRVIVDGINVMIDRMEQGTDARSAENAERRMIEMRSLIEAQHDADPPPLSSLIEQMDALQMEVMQIIRGRAARVTPNRPTKEQVAEHAI